MHLSPILGNYNRFYPATWRSSNAFHVETSGDCVLLQSCKIR